MHYSTIFFDLDDTLYPKSTGLWTAIRLRIDAYMRDRLRIPEADIVPLRERYHARYGTTLRGLQADGIVDPDDYLEYVHRIPLGNYLSPDPGLRDLIRSLPQARWIFTNSDAAHARRVLAALDLDDCFSGIIDVRALDYIAKPDPEAYVRALAIAGARQPQACVIFDDSPRNLHSAGEMGYFTVQVGLPDEPNHAADRNLPDWSELPRVFPELWAPDLE